MYTTRSERHLDKWFTFIYLPGALCLMGFTLMQVKFFDYLFQGNMPEMVAYALLMVIAMNFVLGTYAVVNGCQYTLHHLTTKKMSKARQARKIYYLTSYAAYIGSQMLWMMLLEKDTIHVVKDIMYIEGWSLCLGLTLYLALYIAELTSGKVEEQEETATNQSSSMGVFVSKETEEEIVEFDLIKEKIIKLEQYMSDLNEKEAEYIITSIKDVKDLFTAYESLPLSQKDQARCGVIQAFLHMEKELGIILNRVERKQLHRIEKKVKRIVNR